MNANQAKLCVPRMCRVLQVSPSGYYAWVDRPPSKRVIDDAVLVERIRSIHAESDATYGMPRVRAERLDQGVKINGKRVARLMRANAIRGVSRRRGFVVTTQRDPRQRPAPDLVKLDLEHCPNCAGELKIIAAILEAPVIERILTHLALQARVPPRAPARGQTLLHAA